MRRAYFWFRGLLTLFCIAGCFLSPHNIIERRSSLGHWAPKDWADRYLDHYGRHPSKEQSDQFWSQLKEEVERYIAANAEVSGRKKQELRSFYVYPGMKKTEVRLFLNGPVEVKASAEEISKQAGKFWPEFRSGIDEAWSYKPYTYFFAGDTLVDIIVQQPRFQPL